MQLTALEIYRSVTLKAVDSAFLVVGVSIADLPSEVKVLPSLHRNDLLYCLICKCYLICKGNAKAFFFVRMEKCQVFSQRFNAGLVYL